MRQISPYRFTVAVALEAQEGTRWRPGSEAAALAAERHSSQRLRIVDAALACLARQGTTKTTLDDIAREAALSRATLYRCFPGGREAVWSTVVATETTRLFAALAAVMGEADDLETVVVNGIVESIRRLRGHRALAYLLEHEPGVILPHLAFSKMDELLATASTFAAPFFERWLDPENSARAAEWTVRIVNSYVAAPGDLDLAEEADTRRLVRTFVLPGLAALAADDGGDPTNPSNPSNPSNRNIRSDRNNRFDRNNRVLTKGAMQ